MILSLIDKKKRGLPLTREEITWFIRQVVDEQIPLYQISALLMAIYCRGMSETETYDLTLAMRDSGQVLTLTDWGLTIDKHSTGGIGDKLSLVVLPLWAAAGFTIVKLSGRGLGFTGGTIDKLSAVPGVQCDLDLNTFTALAKKSGIVISAQSDSLAPADKILYALRDVTGTVDSIPLIAASIMSKKLAVAAQVLVLDVKYGRGAFMKTRQEAVILAKAMIDVGERAGQRIAALLSPMDHPLGMAVGNSLEIEEAYQILKGEGSLQLQRASLTMAALGFYLARPDNSWPKAMATAEKYLLNGDGLSTFLRFLKGQGASFPDDDLLASLPVSGQQETVTAETAGYIADIDALAIGEAAMNLGAGRHVLADEIDYGAGIRLQREVGDYVASGGALAVLHGETVPVTIGEVVRRAIRIEPQPVSVDKRQEMIVDGKTIMVDESLYQV